MYMYFAQTWAALTFHIGRWWGFILSLTICREGGRSYILFMEFCGKTIFNKYNENYLCCCAAETAFSELACILLRTSPPVHTFVNGDVMCSESETKIEP